MKTNYFLFIIVLMSVFNPLTPLAWSNTEGVEASLKPQRELKALSLKLLEPSEALKVLDSELNSGKTKPNHTTMISSTEEKDLSEIEKLKALERKPQSKKTQALEAIEAKKAKRLYFNFPFKKVSNRASRHFHSNLEFYQKNKAAVALLTVLTANSSVNWFIFSPNISASSSGIIVGVNAFLYAYLGVNTFNWSGVLKESKRILQKNKHFNKLGNKAKDFISIMASNTVYNLAYYGSIEAILNWDNLSRLLSGDVIGLILRNTAVTVSSSGVWDLVFNEWEERGKITKETRRKMSWARSILMVTLGNLMAIGYDSAFNAMLAVGTQGVLTYLFEVHKEKFDFIIKRLKSVMNIKGSFSFMKFFKSVFNFNKENKLEQIRLLAAPVGATAARIPVPVTPAITNFKKTPYKVQCQSLFAN